MIASPPLAALHRMQSRKRLSMRITARLTQEFHIGRVGAMAGMQRPAVILLDETPLLFGQPQRQRISLNVTNRSPDFVGMVQEDFPTASTPGGMSSRSMRDCNQSITTCRLEKLDH